MKTYNVSVKDSDPVITIKIPSEILKDIALRSGENGNSIELEIALRLARSLERDLKMIEDDNQVCIAAFEMIKNNKDFTIQISELLYPEKNNNK